MINKGELAASALTIFSVALILVEYIAPLSDEELFTVMVVDGVVVAILSAELVIRAKRSNRFTNYILKHWYEVFALLPLFLFYLLEMHTVFGALIRSLRLSRVLRLFLVMLRTRKSVSYLLEVLKASRLGYLFLISAVVVFLGTFSAFLLEAGFPDSRIRDLGDAFWWALATVTTVGYGDVVPVTVAGRIVGSVLMITGIAIIGVFISSLGSTLLSLQRGRTSPVEEIKNLLKEKIDKVEELSEEELTQVLELIKALRTVNGKIYRR